MSRWQYLNIWSDRVTNYWRPCTATEAARYCTSGIKVRLIGEPVTTDTIFDLAAPDCDVAPAMPLMFQFQYINQDGHVCTKTIPIDGAVIEDGQMVLSFTEPIHRPKQFFMSATTSTNVSWLRRLSGGVNASRRPRAAQQVLAILPVVFVILLVLLPLGVSK